jgi:glutathione synthase/RimK-type ligase-like ATP-grasp enzyme
MIAIHNDTRTHLFHYRWIDYCDQNKIPYKLVNCYENTIIDQLKDCSALMWHYHQASQNDIVMAKSLLFSLEQSGMKVFPDFNTAWHFDDKVGQKYLFEALQIDTVKTWVFYDAIAAFKWINEVSFPKVFKLRGGAASQNVQLVHSKSKAQKLVKRAFGKGFPAYDSWGSLKERYRKWRLKKANFKEVVKGIIRLVKPPRYAQVMGNEIDYIYFQEFIPNNDSDTRIIVIDGKAFALKRMVRDNDFRASGSGDFRYEREVFDERCVKMSFEYSKKLKAQCVAYDYVFDQNNTPKLIEISYGFANQVYDPCTGYWDEQMNWYEGKFNPYGWMVDILI